MFDSDLAYEADRKKQPIYALLPSELCEIPTTADFSGTISSVLFIGTCHELD
jgi:hypothetical protein